MGVEVKKTQLGCYIELHLTLDELNCSMSMQLDSGAQCELLMPIRFIPVQFRSRLTQAKNLAGISGTKLPVAGSIIINVTLGGITRATEVIVIDESLDLPSGLIGLQFMVDFKISIDCNNKMVYVLDKPIPSEFLELDELSRQNFQKALAARNKLNIVQSIKLNASARKIEDIYCWVQYQTNYSKNLYAPHLGGESELIFDDSLECIRLLYKINNNQLVINKACQVDFPILSHFGVDLSGNRTYESREDQSCSEISSESCDSLDTQNCLECRAFYWDKLFETLKCLPATSKNNSISPDVLDIRALAKCDGSTQIESSDWTYEAKEVNIYGEYNRLKTNLLDQSNKNNGEIESCVSSLTSAQPQPEKEIDFNFALPNETDEYLSVKAKHTDLSVDQMVNVKRMRCPACHTNENTVPESTLGLSIFCIKKDITLAPLSATPVNVYIKNANNNPAHLEDDYFVPQQYLMNCNSSIVQEAMCTTRFNNNHRIMLVNVTDTELIKSANMDLGYAVRLLNKNERPTFPNPPACPIKPTLSKQERCTFLFDKINLDHLQPDEQLEIRKIISEFHSLFYIEESDYRVVRDYEYTIKLKNNNKCYVPQFRLKKEHNIVLKQMIEDMLNKKLIEPIDPAKDSFKYNSPVFILKKVSESGEVSWRFLQDSRKVNSCIELNSINSFFDTVSDQLFNLDGKNIYTNIDIKSAFFCLALAKQSRPLTAFSIGGQRYQFTVTSQGNVVSPSCWGNWFTNLLKDIIASGNANVYVDDCLLANNDFPSHTKTLRSTFVLLHEKEICISPAKFQVAKREIQYVGYLITPSGVTVDPSRITALMRIARPQTKTELKSFLGSVAFYFSFIQNYAELISVLTPLTCAKAPFIWTEHTDNAWAQLKMALASPPILQYIKIGEPLYLFTDSSLRYCSGVLTRKVQNVYLPVSFFSRKITLSKRFLTIQILELIAIAQALQKFKPLITGKIYAFSDNKVLCENYKIYENPKIARLAMYIAQFDIEFTHILGIHNNLADYFSRATRIEHSINLLRQCQHENDTAIKSLRLKLQNDIYPEPYIDAELILSHQERDTYVQKIQHAMATDARLLLAYKYNSVGLLYVTGNTDVCDRLIIPRSLANYFINLYHTCPVTPHPSAERLYYTMARSYFLVNMKRIIDAYTAKCVTCQRVKRNPHDKKSPYNPFPIPSYAFEHVSMDICMIGRKCDNKKNYIGFLTIVCGLTKYVYIKGIRNQSAEEIARKFWKFCLERGSPVTVLADNGGCFHAKLFKAMCALCESNLTMCTSYWSRGNARAENANKRCVMVLRSLMDQHPNSCWTDYIKTAQSAMNVTYNSSIKNTPHYLVYLRDFRFHFENYIVEQREPITNYDDFLVVQKRRYFQALDMAQKNQQLMNQKNQKQYDKTTAPKTFKEQDLVWCFRPTLSAALANKLFKNKYAGPFRVTKKVFDHVYDITDLVTLKTQRVNGNRLKPFNGYLIFQEDSDEEPAYASFADLELQAAHDSAHSVASNSLALVEFNSVHAPAQPRQRRSIVQNHAPALLNRDDLINAQAPQHDILHEGELMTADNINDSLNEHQLMIENNSSSEDNVVNENSEHSDIGSVEHLQDDIQLDDVASESSYNDIPISETPVVTRSGRVSNPPKRYSPEHF